MDVRSSCPICGQAEVGSLPDHLNSHSKQSLIDILLVQHQQIRKQHPTSNALVHIEREDECTRGGKSTSSRSDIEGSDGANQILLEFHPSGNEISSSNNGSLIRFKTDPLGAPSIEGNSQKISSNSIVHIEFDSNAVTESSPPVTAKSHAISKVESATLHIGNRAAVEATKLRCGKPTFVLVDHSPCKPGPSRRRSLEVPETPASHCSDSDASGIQPSTSIIQYIIDESGQITDSPQEEPDSWILADGRTIPVYSSLTQVPAVSDATPACTMTVDISSKGNEADTIPITVERNPSQNMHLELMTDEEIPPRGEISEYEESNASSILSEDSNLRTVGMLSESRRSPVVHEHNIHINRKKKSPKTALTQQYMCYECPQVQEFSSLFDLAEHKFESHQNKLLQTSTTVTISSDQDSVHILPEKIRRQSQNDEPDIPATDPLADLSLATASGVNSSSMMTKEYFCVYCNFTAKKKSALAGHMESAHVGKPRVPTMFECTYCGKVFRARTNLRKHLLIHKDRKYHCPTCSKGFTSNFKLMEHIRVHTKIYPFKCTGCEKTYRTPSLLNHHIKMVHLPEAERPPKRKLEFYCGVCHRILHSKRSYVNHCQLHQEKPIKCSFCSETFTRHSVLVRHIRIAHDPQYESKESKDCPVCHKKLHPNSMIKHMRIHSNEKPYSCNVCGKFFRTYANLTSHSWSHTNVDKPHKCRLCSKSYLFKKNLENHMMVHKKRTMHFVCNECGVKFTHKVNMKRHLEEHFKEKNHVCKVCGKAFQRNYYLIEHERIHTGVKPYTCNICGKLSTTKSNHRAHLKIHDARETGNQEG